MWIRALLCVWVYFIHIVLDGMITFKTRIKKNKNSKKGFYGHNSRTSWNPRLVSRSIGWWAVDWRIICIIYIYIGGHEYIIRARNSNNHNIIYYSAVVALLLILLLLTLWLFRTVRSKITTAETRTTRIYNNIIVITFTRGIIIVGTYDNDDDDV